MKIYYPGKNKNQRTFVTPGTDHPDQREWREIDGRVKTFDIHFINGVAEVDDKLGKYCIEKGYAQKTRFVPPRIKVA